MKRRGEYWMAAAAATACLASGLRRVRQGLSQHGHPRIVLYLGLNAFIRPTRRRRPGRTKPNAPERRRRLYTAGAYGLPPTAVLHFVEFRFPAPNNPSLQLSNKTPK